MKFVSGLKCLLDNECAPYSSVSSCRRVEVSAEDIGWVCLRRRLWMNVGVYPVRDLTTDSFLQGVVLIRQPDRDSLIWSGTPMPTQVRALDGYVFHTDSAVWRTGGNARVCWSAPTPMQPAHKSRPTSAPPLRPKRTATSNHDVYGAWPHMVGKRRSWEISLRHWDCRPPQTNLVSLLINVLRLR